MSYTTTVTISYYHDTELTEKLNKLMAEGYIIIKTYPTVVGEIRETNAAHWLTVFCEHP